MALARAWIAFACAALATGPALAQAPAEPQVKAAFLFNIVRFVSWPQEARALRVCTVGEDAVVPAILALSGKSVEGRALQARAVAPRAASADCDVVYLAASLAGAAPDLLDALERRPVLTVGDSAGLAEQGAIVNFFLHEERVRFEVNPAAAQRAGLKISSQLMQLARIARDERRQR